MKRRTFLQAALATPFIAGLPIVRDVIAAAQGEGWRTYEVVTKLEIVNPSGVSRAWVPLPYTAKTDWHTPLGNTWSGNGQVKVVTESKYGAEMLCVEWEEGEKAPVLEVSSRFATRDRAVDFSRPNPNAPSLSQAEMSLYTGPTELIPTDSIVRETALDITRHARTDIERAHAIYEWVVDNTFRDPKVKGCGWGDIKTMLETRYFGGKCGDLNALFVGLARSVGVAARDIYGVRVAPSQLGYKSLGLGSTNASKGQHCRAEFFAQGIGWVPVDPADVRKVVLEESPGNLHINDPKVVALRRRLFGAWEMNWLAYNTAHDVVLPNSRTKIAYFMYPNGETGGKALDQLDPDTFKYTITAQQIKT
ncbi:transglutaminase domain-containing protein [Nitrosomonas sp. Is37]|uniref:transglutaminase-like domain-containing protein n=1 Tax=Nitrosomonas sp. Is37 TaxID=3080535 RepID=UPI00294ADB65|nr:transglutaminase domain-containing protein [Nitrosomonas sp. Is37]MDV6345608.1 transglutaminase domain-containing protein [Nitrosomonas sp. Is37]